MIKGEGNESMDKVLFKKMLSEKCKEFGLTHMEHKKEKNIVSIYSLEEDFHLFLTIQNELVPPLNLQYNISFEPESCDYVRCLIFPDPVIISDETKDEFIKFVNVVNRFVLYGFGRFWIDLQLNDLAYEIVFPTSYFNNDIGDMGKQIFDIPIAHFTDMQNPLYMLKKGEWNADQAIQYFEEMHEKGFVDNMDYGLW